MRFVRIVRPEHRAPHAVRVRLFDYFPVDAGLQKLHLLTAAADSALDDVPRRVPAADVGMCIHGSGGTQHIGVGVVCQKLRHDLRRLMRVAALVGAADDDVRVLPRDVREILIETEIIADQKAATDVLDLDHGRLGKRKGGSHVSVFAVYTAVHRYWNEER